MDKKINLSFPDNTPDFKYSLEEAEKVKINDIDLLVDYLDTTSKLVKDYLGHLDESTLDEIIDENYTLAVTRQTTMDSIIDVAVMHSG